MEIQIGRLDDGTRIFLHGDSDRGWRVSVRRPGRPYPQDLRDVSSHGMSWAMADVDELSGLLLKALARAHVEDSRAEEVKARLARIRETGEDMPGPGG